MANHTIVSHLDIIYAVSGVWVDMLTELRPTIYTQVTMEKIALCYNKRTLSTRTEVLFPQH